MHLMRVRGARSLYTQMDTRNCISYRLMVDPRYFRGEGGIFQAYREFLMIKAGF